MMPTHRQCRRNSFIFSCLCAVFVWVCCPLGLPAVEAIRANTPQSADSDGSDASIANPTSAAPSPTDPSETVALADDLANSPPTETKDEPAAGQNTAADQNSIENQLIGQQRPSGVGHPSSAATEPAATSVLSPWRSLMSLVIVIAVILAGTYCFKRFVPTGRRMSNQGGLEIVARNAINPKQSLCLVKMGPRLLLVGLSPNHIASLDVIDDPDDIAQMMANIHGHTHLSNTSTFGKLFGHEANYFEDKETTTDLIELELRNGPNPPFNQVRTELAGLLEKVKGLTRLRSRSR